MQVGYLSMLSFQVTPAPPCMHALEHHAITQAEPAFVPTTLAFIYKKAVKKVHPVAASLPEDFCIIQHCPEDPLLTLSLLPTHPPPFTDGVCLTQAQLDDLNLNCYNFLWPEELQLAQHILKINKRALAWTEDECGCFHDEYFTPVKIPTITYTPWVHKNIPIPMGIMDKVIDLFKKKIMAGVYELSNASY